MDVKSNEELNYLGRHLKILSGLYGILSPFDMIQAYRLEMGTKLSVDGYKNLYSYWTDVITDYIQTNPEFLKDRILINLASAEYFKSIDLKKLNARIVTPVLRIIRMEYIE